MKFFTKIKHRPFMNLVDLIEEVLRHFLMNGDKTEEREHVKTFLSEDYGDEFGGVKTFNYCPNILLNNIEASRKYKNEIAKLLYKAHAYYNL